MIRLRNRSKVKNEDKKDVTLVYMKLGTVLIRKRKRKKQE